VLCRLLYFSAGSPGFGFDLSEDLSIARWATLNLWTSRAVSVHVSDLYALTGWTHWLKTFVFRLCGIDDENTRRSFPMLPNPTEFFYLPRLQSCKSLSVPVEHVHWPWPCPSSSVPWPWFCPSSSVGWCKQKNQLGHIWYVSTLEYKALKQSIEDKA
jgi:hypothetical protein